MSKYSIGIDLGGTKILTALIDKENGEVLAFEKKKTKKDKGAEKIVNKIINSIKEVLSSSNKTIDEIEEIGLGAAGQVNRENGIIINAPNLDCKNLNIKEALQKEFNKPIYLGNDVEIATIGELYFGAACSLLYQRPDGAGRRTLRTRQSGGIAALSAAVQGAISR